MNAILYLSIFLSTIDIPEATVVDGVVRIVRNIGTSIVQGFKNIDFQDDCNYRPRPPWFGRDVSCEEDEIMVSLAIRSASIPRLTGKFPLDDQEWNVIQVQT